MACPLFQAALAKEKSLTSVWRRTIAFFQMLIIDGWDSLYKAIAQWSGPIAALDTS